MSTRREFPHSSAAALSVAAARPIVGWQAANNRVRTAVMGCGNRAGRVFELEALQTETPLGRDAEAPKSKAL